MGTNVAWHEDRGIELKLYREDLNNPDIPGLMDEILTPPAAEGKEVTGNTRNRHMLKCMECHEKGTCRSLAAGKGPWVSIRKARINGRVQLVPVHLPVTHKAGEGESDKHKALNERVARIASACGYSAETEVDEGDADDGKIRADVLIIGEGGLRYSWETHLKPCRWETVAKRDRRARELNITPNWFTTLDDVEWIERVNWTRGDDMSWQDIDQGRQLLIRGGYRRFQIWKCTPTARRPCPDGNWPCWAEHYDAKPPALCWPPLPNIDLDDLVIGVVSGAIAPVFVPHPDNPRRGARMWMPTEERDKWRELRSGDAETEALQSEPAEDVHFDDEAEEDRECAYGKPGFPLGSPRPKRDLPMKSFASTVEGSRPAAPPELQRLFSSLTASEIKIVAEIHGRSPEQIGPCKRCWRATPRYGYGSQPLCHGCRSAGYNSSAA